MTVWWWLAAALARPLYVVETPGQPFVVVDERGRSVNAWHFAHAVGDGRTIDKLAPVIYGRRLAIIATSSIGLIATAGGFAALLDQQATGPRGIRVDPGVAAAGALAAGGLLLGTAGTFSIARHKPRVLTIDRHYTADEARHRLAGRRKQILVVPAGVIGTF